MAEEITAASIREILAAPDPALEALSMVLRQISTESVAAAAYVINMLQVDLKDFPGEYLVQALLVEADKVLKPISREGWIKVYDSYVKIKALLEENPEIVAGEVAKAEEGSVLDGLF